MPKSDLNIAVNQLIEDISIKVLGKRKLEDNDSVIINGGVELFCNIFNIFRQDS
jgi:hypothetical protein